jgi:hypothetical protein
VDRWRLKKRLLGLGRSLEAGKETSRTRWISGSWKRDFADQVDRWKKLDRRLLD